MANSKIFRQRGVAYLALLLLVAVLGVGLAATGTVWSQAIRRDNERELLRAGQELREAIAQYYQRSPGAVKRYPSSLDELLLDKRHLSLQRYLRRIPIDPVTRSKDWGIVRAPDGGVMGVFSRSQERPLKVAGFMSPFESFSGTQRYSDWSFVYVPESPAQANKQNRK